MPIAARTTAARTRSPRARRSAPPASQALDGSDGRAEHVLEGGQQRGSGPPPLPDLIVQGGGEPGHGGQLAIAFQRVVHAARRLEELERHSSLIGEQPEQVELDEAEGRALGPVKDRQHPERALFEHQRRGHDALRHIAGAARDVRREARIVRDVLDHDRLARAEHPAGDPGIARHPATEEILALAGDRLEHELLAGRVEQHDRRGARAEDRARDVGDRLQQRRAAARRRQGPGRHRGAQIVVPAHPSPLTLSALRWSAVLTSNGRRPGCAPSTRAAIPAMCGVANELPDARIVAPPAQATSTSTPRAWNSTGGRGLWKKTSGSASLWLATDRTDAKRQGQLEIGMLWAEATIT